MLSLWYDWLFSHSHDTQYLGLTSYMIFAMDGDQFELFKSGWGHFTGITGFATPCTKYILHMYLHTIDHLC